MPRHFVLVVKGIILPSVSIEFSSILTRFCLVWNSITTVLSTCMCNLLDLSHNIIQEILITFLLHIKKLIKEIARIHLVATGLKLKSMQITNK